MSAALQLPFDTWTPAERQTASLSRGHGAVVYRDVSCSQLSLSRHDGSAMINGQHYTYILASDELIRSDVLQLIAASRKCAAKVARDAAKAKQGRLL